MAERDSLQAFVLTLGQYAFQLGKQTIHAFYRLRTGGNLFAAARIAQMNAVNSVACQRIANA